MRRLGNMMREAVGRDEVIRAATAQRVLAEWHLIVGREMAERSQPDRYDHGTVWVAVDGSAWAQELRMIKETILERLRARVADPSLFINIRFGTRPFKKADLPAEQQPLPMDPEARAARRTSKSIREIAEERLKKWSGEKGA